MLKESTKLKPLLLKIATQSWINSSRDKRELSAAREAGFDICVMAKGNTGDKFKKDRVEGFDVYYFSTRPLGDNSRGVAINRVLSVFTWAGYVRRFKADVISGHDIIALLIAYLSCWYKPRRSRPKLVYDSHEFELLRDPNRTSITLFFIRHTERFLMKRCVFSIMVNDSIADDVQRIHKLKKRPLVVRSIPDKWEIDATTTTENRELWLGKLGLSKDTFVLMYHGIVKKNRGIEELIETVAETSGTALIVLGDAASADYIGNLKHLCENLGVEGRILFIPSAPLSELWKYIGAADVGMIVYSNTVGNYQYLLPNKFFENIQAETPVICYNTPELAKLTSQYDIGLLVSPADDNSIKTAIQQYMSDKSLYYRHKRNTRIAKTCLCWEQEKQPLVDAYKCLKKVL